MNEEGEPSAQPSPTPCRVAGFGAQEGCLKSSCVCGSPRDHTLALGPPSFRQGSIQYGRGTERGPQDSWAEVVLTFLDQASSGGKTCPRATTQSSQSIQGQDICTFSFTKQLPDLSVVPPCPRHLHSQAFLSLLHRNVYSHQCSPSLHTSKSAPRCSVALPSSSPPALCSEAVFQRASARLPLDMTSGQCATCSRGACFLLGRIHRATRTQGYTNPSDMFKELPSICKETERKTNMRMKGFL